jgi:hypothetical protein
MEAVFFSPIKFERNTKKKTLFVCNILNLHPTYLKNKTLEIMQAHEIDYHIFGEEMQYVEIELDPQEIVIAEAGSFMMMEKTSRWKPFLEMVPNNNLGRVCLANF